jgi:arylsulfatase A-like enzyme
MLHRPLLFVIFLCLGAPAISGAAGKPNVVMIVVDDLGWAGVGYHAKNMPTPNLDKLAAEGMKLERFYVYPVCSPTRAALLTGRMPRGLGIVNPLGGPEPGLPGGLPTISSTFKAAGYATSLIGKWHLGRATTPQQNGFDHFYGFITAEVDYYRHTSKNGRLDWQRDGQPLEEQGYSTYLFADDAVRQIKARDRSKPFYLQITFNAPHDPLSAPQELVGKHRDKGQLPGLYAAVVEAMDIGIGRVLGALDAENLREETIVIFFSDNGASRREGGSNDPLRMGKGTVYEGGIRTPAAIRWPGRIPGGVALTHPICVQDLYPTLAAACGVAMPREAKIDGSDQWPAISQGRPLARDPFIVASFDIALIDGAWKLIEFQQGGRSLYNLKDDISEATDLFPARTDVASQLGAKLDALKKDLPAITSEQETRRAGPGSGKGPPGKGKRPPPKF